MIWGYHYFRKPTHVCLIDLQWLMIFCPPIFLEADPFAQWCSRFEDSQRELSQSWSRVKGAGYGASLAYACTLFRFFGLNLESKSYCKWNWEMLRIHSTSASLMNLDKKTGCHGGERKNEKWIGCSEEGAFTGWRQVHWVNIQVSTGDRWHILRRLVAWIEHGKICQIEFGVLVKSLSCVLRGSVLYIPVTCLEYPP